MPSAIDAFRAQREAAEGIHGCLQQIAELLTRLRQEADAIAHNDDLRAVLQREESWLEQADAFVNEIWPPCDAEIWPPLVDGRSSS